MAEAEIDALIKDVWHYVQQGLAMPIRYNINSMAQSIADRLRPDWIMHKARIGGERLMQLKRHDARSLVGTAASIGASSGGTVAGHAIATAAGLTVGGAVLGAAAATGIGVGAAAILAIGVIVVKSKVESNNRSKIHEILKSSDRTATEKELFYLLSHGELMNLARSFEKAHKAEELFAKESRSPTLNHGVCIQVLKQTYALLYWKKRLVVALMESPRLLALKQFQTLIEAKMVQGIWDIMLAQDELLKYAEAHGEELEKLHPNEFRKAPGLPDDEFFEWPKRARALTAKQKQGLALLLQKTRPSKLSNTALNALGEIVTRLKTQVGNRPEQLPVLLVQDVGKAFLVQVVGNATAGMALRAGMAGASGGALAGGALISAGLSFAMAVPAELISSFLINVLNDRLNLTYLKDPNNDVAEKVYRLRDVLEHGRVAAIHNGYKVLDDGCQRLEHRFNEPLHGGDEGFRRAVEIAKVMQDGIYHFMIMQGMMYYVGMMLELIQEGVDRAHRWYTDRSDDFKDKLPMRLSGFHLSHDECQGTCYWSDNYHPLR